VCRHYTAILLLLLVSGGSFKPLAYSNAGAEWRNENAAEGEAHCIATREAINQMSKAKAVQETSGPGRKISASRIDLMQLLHV